MSRVKQRVPIGYPRSPRTLCTALPEREGAETQSALAPLRDCVITHLFVILLQGRPY